MLYVVKFKDYQGYSHYEYFTEGEKDFAIHVAKIRKQRGLLPIVMSYNEQGASLVWSC